MKTVGKQLEEARLARNWTPELASRETKIKIERLRELEADDYSHFASPTYARGFVRTYARALGLDEYRILRQLDNKLPDDDSVALTTDTGVAYLPETAMPPRVAHRDYTGLYIVMTLGAVVTLAIVFVLFEAYRVGELSNWFAGSPEPAAAGPSGTNANGAPAVPTATATPPVARALPVDSNTPPPIVDTTSATNAASATNAVAETPPAAPAAPGDVTAPRALPVDPSLLAAGTNAAPVTEAPVQAVRALPVDASEPANAPPVTPPRALPVNPADLGADSSNAPVAVAVNTPAPAAPSMESAAAAAAVSKKRLVLTATQDSFVRVTDLDAPDADKPLYADVLHSGQSIGFDGHKFSINVGVPSAVAIKLDGVNYGPHSDGASPETFTVESHLP